MPDTAEAYTHRIGRTGRAARTGDAFTLVTDEDADMVRAIERVLGAPVTRRTVPGFDYNAPAPARNTEFARPPREAQPSRRPRVAPPVAAPAAPARPAVRPAAPAPRPAPPSAAPRRFSAPDSARPPASRRRRQRHSGEAA